MSNLFTLPRLLGSALFVGTAILAYVSFRAGPPLPWRAGLAVLGMTYAVYVVISESWNPFRLALGADNRYSLSKLQFLLWTFTIGFGVAALLAQTQFTLPETPLTPNLFLALGFSSLTALSAKAVTTRQTETGETTKTSGDPDFRQFLLDDGLRPDLTKFQMLFWTIVAIIAFVGQLPTTVIPLDPQTAARLPEISVTFLVLMGLAQGTYLGTKLVTTDTPRMTGIAPGEALIGTNVTLFGAAFGASQGGSQIRLSGVPLTAPPVRWTDTQIEFTVPRDRLGSLDVQLVVGARESNALPLSVVPLRLDSLSSASGKAGQSIDIAGVGFGDVAADVQVSVGTTAATVTSVSQRAIRFVIPNVPAATYDVQVKRKNEASGTKQLQVVV